MIMGITFLVIIISGHFLEKKDDLKCKQISSLSNKVAYFYKESIVYTFVNIAEGLRIRQGEFYRNFTLC